MSTFLVPTRGWGGLENTYHVKKEGMGKRGGREVSSCHPGACHGEVAFPLPRRQRKAKEGGKEGATPQRHHHHPRPPQKGNRYGRPEWGGEARWEKGQNETNEKHHLQMSRPGWGGPRALQGRPPKAGGDAKAAELVSGSLFSGASCEEAAVLASAAAAAAAAAALACRSARTALECLHLGELQRQLKYLALMFQNLSP